MLLFDFPFISINKRLFLLIVWFVYSFMSDIVSGLYGLPKDQA